MCTHKEGEGAVVLKPVSSSDCDFIFGLQTKDIRKFFRNRDVPGLKKHINWFNKILISQTSQIYVLEFKDNKVGMLRVDDINDQVVEISIIVSPLYSGQGIAKKALKKLEAILSFKTLKAVIHKDNIISQQVFKSCGFKMSKQDNAFMEFFKHV
jgi:RimJ/RimL family protein N-acetyltransferase